MVRSGSFDLVDLVKYCRVAARNTDNPINRGNFDYGFRCVREAD